VVGWRVVSNLALPTFGYKPLFRRSHNSKLPFCCSRKLTKRKTELSPYHGLTDNCKIRNNANEYVAS
jgi:hypothetical protein